MKKAFTLMELLVIIAIIAVMTTVSVLSISGGQKAARVKGATRDIFAAIRQARSQAIVSQKPVVITYSNEKTEDGETVAKVESTSAELFAAPVDPSQIQTLTGFAQRRVAAKTDAKKDEGNLLEEVLFAPIGEDVVRGIRLKAVKGDAVEGDGAVAKRRVSMFSNVDFLIRQYQRMRGVSTSTGETKSEDGEEKKNESKTSDAGADEMTEPLSVVWNTNGRVEPHQVWVYAEGQKPEDGLLVRIDRFGAAKVLSGDGREEDER